MSWWYGQACVARCASPARTDDGLVTVQVDLGLELVPELVVLGSLHVPPQELDLLDPAHPWNTCDMITHGI